MTTKMTTKITTKMSERFLNDSDRTDCIGKIDMQEWELDLKTPNKKEKTIQRKRKGKKGKKGKKRKR